MCFLNLSVVAALKEITALQNRQKMVEGGGVGAIMVLMVDFTSTWFGMKVVKGGGEVVTVV